MSTNYHTATYLLASLKRRGMLASSTESLTDTDFLAFMSDELRSYIVPWLLGVREEHLVTYADQSVTSGTASYDIPTRAIAGRLRDVLLADSAGNYYSLPRLEPEWIEDYGTAGAPAGYYLEANKVVLVPAPSSSGTLRLKYFRRPGRLVAITDCVTITGISSAGAGMYTITTGTGSVPTTFTTGETYDVISGSPGFDTKGTDLSVNAVVTGTGGTLTISSTFYDAALPAVGDFVCLVNESPVPQVPVEIHPLVAERGLVRALESLGDPKAPVAKAACDELERRLEKVLVPRVPGSSRIAINRHGVGFGTRRNRNR